MPLSAADVRALDGNAEALGVPTQVLMENAGRAVADVVLARYLEGLVAVFAGPGNNGGDGLVAARRLREAGRQVRVLLSGREDGMRTEAAERALRAAIDAGVPVLPFSDVHLEEVLDEADIAVDALLGIGVSGVLRSPFDRVVAELNEHEIPIVAVDVPTGHGAEGGLFASVTVTFHDRKVGMDEEVCGDVVVADIGIPADAVRYVGPGDLAARFPRTPSAAHKGDMGRILIVAGGPYTGAPVLSALGVFGVGTDLVFMAVPGAAANVARNHLVEAIVRPLEGERLSTRHVEAIEGWLDECDVLCIGPGLGKDEDTMEAARRVVLSADARGRVVVADADALTAFTGDERIRATRSVLTPHAGEFRRLTGIDITPLSGDARVEAVQGWLGDGDAVVLLKGAEDVIVSREGVSRNRMHHAVMTTGGTGDVLAGVVAGLAGRGMSRFDAARVGAFINGAAGQVAFARKAYGVRSGDVAAALPAVLVEHL